MKHNLFLKSINLRNFATFENQEINFNKKFNGIIGETGSGKSLILDGFQLLLGARSDRKLVRRGSECAIIEGTFIVENENIISYFDQMGFPLEDTNEVIIKRIIYPNGKSKSFLNHMTCPLSALSHFSKSFVDLVGQFENQKLGNSDYQLYLLDQFSSHSENLNSYKEKFDKYKTIKNEIETIKVSLSDKRQREDYIRFQLNEITHLNPSLEREKQLKLAKDNLQNKEENFKKLEDLKSLCSEGENNIMDSLKYAEKLIGQTKGIFTEDFENSFSEQISSLEDLFYEVSRTSLDSDEEEPLEDILEELDKYQKLKRKFNVATEEIIALQNDFQIELSSIEELDKKLKSLSREAETLENSLFKEATALNNKRVISAKKLSSLISKELHKLNMEGSSFEILVTKGNSLNETGLDHVTFKAETNPGEGFFKIKEIASGGELSRILLCLRQIVAAEDSISIFFFDEIDTGIGGETAVKIAEALKKVSEKSQVLAITHLPQIAKAVDEIIYVDKKSIAHSDKTRTVSFVQSKTGKDREEIVKQLAGL